MPKNDSDRIRRMYNSFTLAGQVAQITRELKIDNTQTDGSEYISMNVTVRCGDSPVYDKTVRIFAKALKADGTQRENYEELKEWCQNVVPLTKSTENATWVEFGGGVSMNDYVAADGTLRSSVQYSAGYINPFTEYKAELNLEGVIQGITDEVDNEENPTGRKRVRILSADFTGNCIDLRCIADEEIASQMEDAGFEKGAMSTFFLTLKPNESAPKVSSGGFGEKRVTGGRQYLELMLTGGNELIKEEDEKRYVSPATWRDLINERKQHLADIEEAGYLGGSSGSAPARKTGFGGAKGGSKATTKKESSDDEMFF